MKRMNAAAAIQETDRFTPSTIPLTPAKSITRYSGDGPVSDSFRPFRLRRGHCILPGDAACPTVKELPPLPTHWLHDVHPVSGDDGPGLRGILLPVAQADARDGRQLNNHAVGLSGLAGQ